MPKLAKKRMATAAKPYLANTLRIAILAAGKKAKDIKAYDVQGMTTIADSFVICTATSEPQLKAIVSSIREGMKEIAVAPLRMEGALSGGWFLIDYGEIIVHVFREQPRDFYDLDGMWGDAPEIPLDLDE